jgi:preprotein translocase subunit SecG
MNIFLTLVLVVHVLVAIGIIGLVLLAVIFFSTSLGLAYLATHKPRSGASVMQGVTVPPAAVPAAPSVPGAEPAKSGETGNRANEVPK